MRALVLGGTGFIGSYVVDQLLSANHEVRVFSLTAEQFRDPIPEVDYRLAGIDNIPALVEALEGVDVVFHFVSTTVPSTSNLDPIYDIESNLVGTVRLLNAMRDSDVNKLIYLSSGGTVYGLPEKVPISEDHPLRPICSYGVIKVAVENYLNMFHKLHGLDYVVLRPSNPYGERQGHYGVQGVIGTYLNKILKGEKLEVWGDGKLVRDFIFVEDLARLCVLAAASDRVGIYNAGSGKGYSVLEVIDAIEKTVGKELPVNLGKGRKFDVPKVVLDIDKALQDFGWHPEVELEEGIGITWERLNRNKA